eukprot:969032_1
MSHANHKHSLNVLWVECPRLHFFVVHLSPVHESDEQTCAQTDEEPSIANHMPARAFVVSVILLSLASRNNLSQKICHEGEQSPFCSLKGPATLAHHTILRIALVVFFISKQRPSELADDQNKQTCAVSQNCCVAPPARIILKISHSALSRRITAT